jgi:hypothetical protein
LEFLLKEWNPYNRSGIPTIKIKSPPKNWNTYNSIGIPTAA